MNERIKELIEQAHDTVEFNYAPSKKIFNKQKFAELVRADEREACAKAMHAVGLSEHISKIAEAIRART